MSPTITSPALLTGVGMILGTAAYMSPEQARGKVVDRRADIWAFGAVLYEMLSGQRAFGGDDVSEVLSRVLQREPEWTALPSGLSPTLVVYLKRCLHRDLKQRIGDIHDVRLALDGAFDIVAPADAALSAVAAPRSVVARALPAVAAVLAVVLGIALWALWRSETPADRPLVRLDVDLGADAAFPPGNSGAAASIAISPDGTRLVYVSGTPTRLFTRRLDQPRATELSGTQGASGPFFSPDGQWVGFAVGRTVNKISVDGGAVVQLAALHLPKACQVLGHAAASVGAVNARLAKVAPIEAHLVGRLLVNIGQASFNQINSCAVHEVKVVAGLVGRIVAWLGPVKAQPLDGINDAVDVLYLFFFRVGVVKAQVAHAAVVACQAKVQANAFGVAHMQVAVWLGRKAQAHFLYINRPGCMVRRIAGASAPVASLVSASSQVFFDDLAQKVAGKA